MHNQLPTEPMMPEATVQGRNNGETTQSIISEYESQDLETLFMKNVDFVQESNDAKLYFHVDVNPTIFVNSLRVPLERCHKVSRYLQDPHMIQPDSTKPNHKMRARHKKVKKRCVPLTAPDGKLIPAWTEDLFRLSSAQKTRVIVPKEIINFLREIEEQYFYFPWSMDEADWAIAGPNFNTFMLRYELSCCYADGVPWFAQSVEKVYFPINVEEVHWILVELHIRSVGHESLLCISIPKLLLKTEVLDKKNIDPTNYSITYRYAVNVPMQGDAYGDCGIWVMRNMHRLVNNLSLEVSNPTQLGLAYREWLTKDFFWKYKILVK
uniref:Phospholipase-like protein n=1 Tax=Tanacetum cinerariifolium TaxID=118510 RepID=A0A6L2K1W0_TANCI|nr:phospholipase-like protein [Tanacetum cinerariifolium]